MNDLMMDAARRGVRYVESLSTRKLYPSSEAIERLHELDQPLQDESVDPFEVLEILDTLGSPATVASTAGRYFGFVIGGSLPVARAANILATAWDQNSGLFAATPVGAVLEEVAQKWLLDLLGLPAGSGISYVTGATMANFSALAAARDALLRKEGWDAGARGLFGAPEIQVVVSAEAHPSVTKALGMLGLGRDRIADILRDR